MTTELSHHPSEAKAEVIESQAPLPSSALDTPDEKGASSGALGLESDGKLCSH